MYTDAEDLDSSGMQRKLEAYNHVLEQEMATLRDGGTNNKRRQQQFLNHCERFFFFALIFCYVSFCFSCLCFETVEREDEIDVSFPIDLARLVSIKVLFLFNRTPNQI